MALTTRVQRLKREFIDQPKSICAERANLITQSYQETEGEHPYIRRAKALEHILSNIHIYIRDGELLVGNQASRPAAASVFPETGANWVLEQLDTFESREMRKFRLSKEDRKSLQQDLPYWEHQTLLYTALQRLNDETKFQYQLKYPVISPNLNLRGHVGHFAADYERIIQTGFQGIEEEVRSRLETLDYAQPGSLDKGCFYKSVLIVCEAVRLYAERYADEAKRLAEQAGTPEERKRELLEIERICRKVPYKGAESFHEALQSLWFTHLIIQIEGDGFAISLGRVDQFLYPAYQRDIQSGNLRKEQAQELVDCFCLKCNEITRLADVPPATNYFGGVNMTQNTMLGGQKADGSDAVNPVSELFLNGDMNVHMDQPNLSIRVHQKTPDSFLMQAVRDMKSDGGKPAVFNDEVIIPSLMSKSGVSLEEARNYAIVGCVEPVVSNNTNGWTNAAMLNMAKCLELALHNGVEPFSGLQIGPKSGAPEELASFEQVVAAYNQQVAYFVKQMVVMLNTWDQMHAELLPIPYMSTLIDGCLESGVDVSRGGAVYNFIGVQGVGLSNVVDSLMALKKVVFEDRELSLREMVDILDRNFEKDEYFRAKLINRVPKFGNNIGEVDELAEQVASAYCNEVKKYRCIRGGEYRPGLFPVASHVPLGAVVGALPSGRLSGTPLNDGISPVSGCDTHGPTMVLLSVSRVNHEEATNGTLLNMKVHPTALKTDEDMEKLCKLIRSFMDLKLMHIQFNVVSREQLLEAQKDPENHRDLIVRVAGYSATFVDLDQKMQDDIINRTEQEL